MRQATERDGEGAAPLPDGAVLRSLLESLPEIITTLSLDLTILSVNKTVPGISVEQVIGVNAFAFIAPEHHEAARRTFDEVIRTGKPSRYEAIGTGPDGAPSWYVNHVGPVLEDGRLIGLTVAIEDVMERKRARAEAQASTAQMERYAQELEEKNRLLEEENAARARMLGELRASEEAQRALSTPIIQAWEGVLALPVIGRVDEARAAQMMERLLDEIVRTRARFAILDLTGAEALDARAVGNLLRIVRAAGLLGSACLVSGVSPKLAETMVAAGSGGAELVTFGAMMDALRYALLEAGVRRTACGR